MSFYREFKRRKVFRVAVVYAATAYAVVEAADLMLPRMGVPDWATSLVVALAVLGLPIALVLAWALEMTPDGVRVTSTETVDSGESTPPLVGRRTVLAAAMLTVLGVGLGAGWFLRPVPAEEPGAVTSSAHDVLADPLIDARSVAVLPFADLSEAGDQAWFADGLTEEILNSLARLPELKVTARTSSFQFRDTERDIRAIADTLGVANVVEGSVRRIGDRLRVTAQLIRAGDGFHLWSDTYDRDAADIFEVQRDVAESIAATLNVFLDAEKRERMFASGTRSVSAFEEFRRGQELYLEAHVGAGGIAPLVEANDHFDRALALDPGYTQAAVYRSDLYGHLVMDGPGMIPVGELDLSQEAAIERLRAELELAAALAPDPFTRAFAEINREYFSPTWHRMPALLESIGSSPGGAVPLVEGAIYVHEIQLLAGELEAAHRLAERRRASDPFNVGIWVELVNVELHRPDLPAARAVLAQARRNVGDHRWLHYVDVLIAQLEGDRASVISLLEARDDEVYWHPAYLAAVRGDRETALRLAAELDQPERWPPDQLLKVYHELGDAARSTSLARRIDALPAGPAILSSLTSFDGGALVFDLDDTPNFAARLAEAGIDPSRFRRMPRLSALSQGQ